MSDPQTKLEERRQRLRSAPPALLPSLLNCDFGHLAAEIAAAADCGAVAVHWDVMDGVFVPNFSYGPVLIANLRSQSDLFFDTHLMMSRPEDHLEAFLQAGCDRITVHAEAVAAERIEPLAQRVRGSGVMLGVALNPPSPIEILAPWLDWVDSVLVMSVMPGFGGQSFDHQVLLKVAQLHRQVGPRLLIDIDGGINRDTIALARQAGAQLFVVGSAFYQAQDRRAAFEHLSQVLRTTGPDPGSPAMSD